MGATTGFQTASSVPTSATGGGYGSAFNHYAGVKPSTSGGAGGVNNSMSQQV